jgi:hypothetical protein
VALYRHRLIGTYPGESWSFGLHTSGNASLAAAQAAWTAGITAFFSVAYAGTLCSDVKAIEATTVELNQTTGKQLTGLTDPRNDTGTNTGECLPFQCAPVVSLRTATLSRAGRGRFYAPSLAVDQVAAGRMVAGAQTALANSALALLQALDNAGQTPVIYHRALGTVTNITSLDVGDVIDTQRRRRNKLIEARSSRQL